MWHRNSEPSEAIIRVSSAVLIAMLACAAPQHSWALERRDMHKPGDLSVEVFVADSRDAFDEWLKTPSTNGPVLRRIHEAKFNQMAYGGFLVTGYTLDSAGKVKFAVDIRVVDPHGKIMLEEKDWAVHDGYASNRGIIMAKNILEFFLESGDPPGLYRIEAVVRDLVANQQAEGTYEIKVSP